MSKRLLVIGAGGHGRSVAEAALAAGGYELAGFVDDGWGQDHSVWGYPVLGGVASLGEYRQKCDYVVVAIGNNAVRDRIQAQVYDAGLIPATIVHPKAVVSPSSTIEAGCTVMAGAVIGTEARLGRGVIVNCGAVVDHDCIVDDFGHLGVNACMAGGSRAGRRAWIQAGAVLKYGMVLAADAVLG